ncbi:hypothetical protein Xhom_03888 [Xenorhabdus hominickii]|uniref:Uncharacterized protein n=1 Tax=Xenorhabdus hominickii TaxID=351679 RepID=A0A2G0Q1B7_XENHO|nr:hypothetical protein Xhom_03888 [Xenorhabdus hominickii]
MAPFIGAILILQELQYLHERQYRIIQMIVV